MRRTALLLLTIIMGIMAVSVIGIFTSLQAGDSEIREVVSEQTAVQVYEEFPVSEINEIKIDLKNENIRVYLSDNQYIRMVYQPLSDGFTFKYRTTGHTLTMTVGEIDNDPEHLLPGSNEIISLYLPSRSYKNLFITTESGFVDITGVSLGSLTVTTQSGYINIRNAEIRSQTTLTSQSGKIFFHDTGFNQMAIKAEYGDVAVSIPGRYTAVNLDVSGTAVWRNEQLLEGPLTLQYEQGAQGNLVITDPGGTVRLKDALVLPEPEEPETPPEGSAEPENPEVPEPPEEPQN